MNKNNKTTIITAGLAALICLLVYLRAVGCEFVNYDDYLYIPQNQAIRILDWEFIREAFHTFYLGAWMPLTWISLAVDYFFWGINPHGYHLTNILLHSANTALVVFIADRVFQGAGIKERVEGFMYPAILLFAGVMWGVHPMRVESVAWISERKDVLNGFFSLGSIYFYLRYVYFVESSKNKKSALVMYLICATSFILSLMAKPVSVVIPAMLLVMDWFPLNRLRQGNIGQVIVEKIPFLSLSAIVSIGTILGAPSGGTNLISYQVFPFFQRVLLSGNALLEYCSVTLYPIGLTFLYLLPQKFPVSYLLNTVLVVLFTCFALFTCKKNPLLASTWALFILPLTPVLGFFQSSAEAFAFHYTYLSAVAPSIAAAGIINWICQKPSLSSFVRTRFLVFGFATLMLIFFSVITYRLITTWQNSETLWTRQILIQPVGRAYKMRAEYYQENARYLEAADDLLKAINIANKVRFPSVHNLYAMRGVALSKAGRYEEAIQELSAAIKLNPQPNYYYHRGSAFKALGKRKEAEDDFISAGNDTGALVWRGLK